MGFFQDFRDFRRGYSDEDRDSLLAKLAIARRLRPDGVIELAAEELKCLVAERPAAGEVRISHRPKAST